MDAVVGDDGLRGGGVVAGRRGEVFGLRQLDARRAALGELLAQQVELDAAERTEAAGAAATTIMINANAMPGSFAYFIGISFGRV